MITANQQSALGYWCRMVAAMKPGERMDVSGYSLRDIPTFEHNGAHFNQADRILENIVGSSYTHSYVVRDFDDIVTFICHEDTGERHYQSPDRRTLSIEAPHER